MADNGSTPPPFDIANFMGGFIIELCIALILYGVTTAQAYVYLLNCKEDSWRLKLMVAAVWILETLHTVFMLRIIYYDAIISFGDFESIAKIDWSIGLVLFAENCIVALVQGYYIRRIWILSGHMVLLIIGLVVLLAARIGFHTTSAVYTFISPTWVTFQGGFAANLCVEVANGLSASVDGIIAASMIFFLQRSRTPFKRTDGVLRWLMAYSVNTGLIMMIFSISIAITYSRVQGSLVFAGLVTIVSKLYANSFLGTLNARDIIRGKHLVQTTTALDSRGFELPKYQNNTGSQGGLRHIALAHTPMEFNSPLDGTRTAGDDIKVAGLDSGSSNDL
ncbi:hypothetical protein QCA50_002680 [Cerrena zonata]|uniref:DUF6534 domain-containing protein n=1 Tax=Cerrena zonata TaxID=2478898 RepID=A0AAW0GUJ9_9APHY